MTSVVRKSTIPVKETIIVPYNNGAVYKQGSTIQLLFGAGDAKTWLVQDSFIQFNIKHTANCTIDADYKGKGTVKNQIFIRDLCQIFDWVEVIYQGKQVYIQNYNQRAKFVDMIRQGGPYLDSQINSYTTSRNVPYTRACLNVGRQKAAGTSHEETGLIVRIPALFDIFEKIVELPLNLLDNQIQLNLHIADPSTYLVNAKKIDDDDVYQFVDPELTDIGGQATQINGPVNIILDRIELHLKDKVDIVSPNKSGTFKFDYTMLQIQERGMKAGDFTAGRSMTLPFNIVTENVSTMGIYFYKKNLYSCSYRPGLINVNFKYGNNTSPFSPINVDNCTHPGIYKEFCNNALDISTSYFGTSNYDYDRSYGHRELGAEDGKEDTHLVLVTDFVSNGKILGTASKLWNSQYNFQAVAAEDLEDCTAVMFVESKYMAFIKDGVLDSVNV